MKKVQFSITTSGCDLHRKVRQIEKFLEKGEQVQVSVQAKRGQGRIFEYALTKLNEIADMVSVPKKVTQPSQKGNGYQLIIRHGPE